MSRATEDGPATPAGAFPPTALTDERTSRSYLRTLRAGLPGAESLPAPPGAHDTEAAPGLPVRVHGDAADGLRPGVVYVHGGGWVLGDHAMHDAMCTELADRAGCVVVSVGYRLAPEHPYPAPVEDVATTYHWMGEHAAELGIDPARLVMMGSSAGGTLALTALMQGLAPTPDLLVLAYPPLDPDLTSASAHEFAFGHVLERDQMRWFWRQYLQDPDLATDPAALPGQVDDLSALPQTVVITAEHDVLRDEGEQFAERLRRQGRLVALHQADGQEHGYLGAIDSDAAIAALSLIASCIADTATA